MSDLTARRANNRWKELVAQLDRIGAFARSLSADAQSLLAQVRRSELDLSLVAKADLDVIAALAHAGRIDGALGRIARTAYRGELPPVDSPRVKALEVILDAPDSLELPALVTAGAAASVPEV